MSWKHPAIWSLAGALVTIAFLPISLRPAPGVAPVPPPPDTVQEPPEVPRPGMPTGLPAVTPQAPAFHWSQLESDDYRQYTANLRAIGCPERTLRDILRADLASALAKPGPASGDSGIDWHANAPKPASLAATTATVDQALESLLGPEPESPIDLSFLPDTEARAVSEWRRRFDALEEESAAITTDTDTGTPSDLAKRRDQELATLLTPAQLEAYQLRHSYLAEELRSELVGFEVSADEFRQLFQARHAEREAADEGHFENADDTIRSVLGEERFARYQQGQDPGFRELFGEVRAAGRSYETAVTLRAEIQAARLASEAGGPTAPDLASIGAHIRNHLGPDMYLLYLEHLGR